MGGLHIFLRDFLWGFSQGIILYLWLSVGDHLDVNTKQNEQHSFVKYIVFHLAWSISLHILLFCCLFLKLFRMEKIFSAKQSVGKRGQGQMWSAGCSVVTLLGHSWTISAVYSCGGGSVHRYCCHREQHNPPQWKFAAQSCVPTYHLMVPDSGNMVSSTKRGSFFYFCIPPYWLGLHLNTWSMNSSLTK